MTSNAYKWIEQEENREKILVSMTQPLTAKQISRKTRIDVGTCSYLLGKLAAKGITVCLNPTARSSRLYWVTDLGRKYQRRLRPDLSESTQDFPSVDWELYGWICFNHRAAIIRILAEPMQPSEMKRKLRQIGSDVRISANNIRDIVRLFLQKGIVQKVFARKKAHPRYELTELGTKLQELLQQAEMPLSFQ
jgi:DNA-binding MarR family transcriptional regulator